ncbi:MAG: hypothetical protein GX862_08990, partial [Leucobacter sp.]|nr:hypothetical protein [Leucobacter sp.]
MIKDWNKDVAWTRRALAGVGGVVAAGLVLAGCSSSGDSGSTDNGSGEAPVQIGLIEPLSGPFADNGFQANAGATLCVD